MRKLSPGAGLALALLVSISVHAAFLHGLKHPTRAPEGSAMPPDRLSVRLSTDRTATLSPIIFDKGRKAQSSRGRESAVSSSPAAGAPDADTQPQVQVAGETLGPSFLAFEPDLYLRPGAVDTAANPVSPEALELFQLTGSQPGLWTVRLYIGENGAVDELEVVDGRGSEINTLELLGLLRSLRFTPALAGGRPVRSQKMLEFSFEPGPTPWAPALLAPPVPGPSATGR